MIELTNISKVFSTSSGSFTALDDVSLTIGSGEVFGIIGESGAGKSTLVRCINCSSAPPPAPFPLTAVTSHASPAATCASSAPTWA